MADDANRIEWLLREGETQRPVPVSERIVIDDDYWQATIQRYDPAEDLRLYLTTAEIRDSPTLDTHHLRPGAWLISNIAVKGTCTVSFADGASVDITPTRSVFFRPAERRGIYTPAPRQALKVAGLMAGADRVRRMFGDDLPEFVADIIGEEGPTRIVSAPASERFRRLAASLFNERLRGPLRHIFMEGAMLQLLATQVAAASGRRRPPTRLTPDERERIRAARRRLLADMANPPTLSRLAADIGLSERALSAGFLQVYGASIYEVLRDERLAHARLALESTDAPIKQIAFRVGYNHVSNFTAAFAARYGAPPARYVRERSPDKSGIE